jgi:hypothetical protein
MTTAFWLNDPSILLNKNSILQLWPSSTFSFEENLNAITRLIVILSILGYFITTSLNILVIGVITLIVIIILYKYKTPSTSFMQQEGFALGAGSTASSTIIDGPDTLQTFLDKEFVPTDKKNPLSNVLLTDIGDNPTRKAAPPSFNTQVYETITDKTKKMVQYLNPGIKNTNQQLFGDLGEKFELDQSMSRYYSTPNTKIPNDQGAYAQFLYGNMPSCRDGDAFACVQDNLRYNNY